MSGPYPELSGELVVLRPFRVEDAAALARASQDPDVLRFTLMPEGMTESDAASYIEMRHRQWNDSGHLTVAITSPESDEFLGQVGVHFDYQLRRAETFYWLAADARGKGLATEALELVTSWALERHDVVRAQLITHIDNTASQRVAERCGYLKEGILRAWEPIKDTQPDVAMWSRIDN